MAARFEKESFEISEPFLDNISDDCPGEQPALPSSAARQEKGSFRLNSLCWICLHLVVIGFYSVIFFFVVGSNLKSSACPSEMLPLPAREAVRWELRPFKIKLIDNPFGGKPRPELEEAWHNLVQSGSIPARYAVLKHELTLLPDDHVKISHETLQALNLSSVRLKDGSADIASLGTFHALHCLVG